MCGHSIGKEIVLQPKYISGHDDSKGKKKPKAVKIISEHRLQAGNNKSN